MWNPDSFLEYLYTQFANERNDKLQNGLINDALETGVQREELKNRLQQSLGNFSQWRTALEPIVLERVEYEDYVQERVELGTAIGLRMPAYVLIPKSVMNSNNHATSAVLAIHGHGSGSCEVVGLDADGNPILDDRNPNHRFAVQMVKRGHVVLAPELVGMGGRKLSRDQGANNKNSCQPMSGHLLMYGLSLVGLRVFEMQCALDYLSTRPEVNSARIGCIGFSGGATVAAYTAALDQRIKAVVLCAFANTYKGSILAVNHCIDNYLPNVLQYAELPQLLGLIAPRPLYLESGDQDTIFPKHSFLQTVEQLKSYYAKENPEKLQYDLFAGSHEVNGKYSFSWLHSILISETVL
ncbi:dienelactone hydrolase family protein [Paenibacillus yanchengensis]|uniref:Dienelactone hydrolase family protein n=1 Tax=Paenibacillus yanchengensis TaxID=2035833 RepID=A0ABW4YH17_9BACL